MADFTDISSSFARLSMALADDAHQAGQDDKATLFIELARAIFDLRESMVAQANGVQLPKPSRRRRPAGAERHVG